MLVMNILGFHDISSNSFHIIWYVHVIICEFFEQKIYSKRELTISTCYIIFHLIGNADFDTTCVHNVWAMSLLL